MDKAEIKILRKELTRKLKKYREEILKQFRGKDANKSVTEMRKSEIWEMILNGFSSKDIIGFGRDEWGLKHAYIERLIGEVNSEMTELCTNERIHDYAKTVKRFEKVYLKAGVPREGLPQGDVRLQKDTLKDMVEILGLKPAEPIDLNVNLRGDAKNPILVETMNKAFVEILCNDQLTSKALKKLNAKLSTGKK